MGDYLQSPSSIDFLDSAKSAGQNTPSWSTVVQELNDLRAAIIDLEYLSAGAQPEATSQDGPEKPIECLKDKDRVRRRHIMNVILELRHRIQRIQPILQEIYD